jgi:hypothetical protein
MKKHQDIEDDFLKVYHRLKIDGFKGYDPYDGLNSKFSFLFPGKWTKIMLTQFLVYFPFQVRPILFIRKKINPKGMGLLLSSLCDIKISGVNISGLDLDKEINAIFRWLKDNSNKQFSGPCWGYHFPWQDPQKFIPQYQPSSVVTSFIGEGLIKYHAISKDIEAKAIIRGIADFMLKDLNTYEDEDGICFSYSPFDNNVVHNANVLTAQFLLKAGSLLNDDNLIKIAKSSYSFSINKQNEDGSWYYSINPKTGKGRMQYDFHQGYMLDSLLTYIDHFGRSDFLKNIIVRGTKFYKSLFLANGTSYFRYPRKWPIDIHNQTQGIITFSRLEQSGFAGKEEWSKILEWTLEKMVSKNGTVYHQKWPPIVNKNHYARWNSAWMLKAFSVILQNE